MAAFSIVLDDVYRKTENQPTVRLDGFSDNPRESVTLPNELFFGADQLCRSQQRA